VTQIPPKTDHDENPFSEMGFVKFWVVSTLFWLCFPISLLVSYIAIGPEKTRQLVAALIHDFVQTILIIVAIFAMIIWAGYQLISGMF